MATDFNAVRDSLLTESRVTVEKDNFANDVISIHNPNGDPNNPNAIYSDLFTNFKMKITEHLDGTTVDSRPLSHEVQILSSDKGVYLEGDWSGASFQTAQNWEGGDNPDTNTGHFEANHGLYVGPARSVNDKFTLTDRNDIVFSFTGNDTVIAGGGNDIVYAGDGADYVEGGAGIDFLYGEAGNDTIFGNTGDDYIGGGDGNDFLYGNQGNDLVFGGAGNDTFVWTVGDGIDDFFESAKDAGTDTLVIKGTTDLYVVRDGDSLAIGTDDNNWAYINNWYADKGMDYVNIGNRNYTTAQIASMASYAAEAALRSASDGHSFSTDGLTAIDFMGIAPDGMIAV